MAKIAKWDRCTWEIDKNDYQKQQQKIFLNRTIDYIRNPFFKNCICPYCKNKEDHFFYIKQAKKYKNEMITFIGTCNKCNKKYKILHPESW
jgi:hypothetical protein